MLIPCVINLLQLILGISAATLLLVLVLGYKIKENRLPFIIVSAVLVLIDLAAGIFMKDAFELSYVTEILVSAAPMFLPYLLTKSSKKLTFIWFGLIFFSIYDYFEFIIKLVTGEVSILTEQLIFCAMYLITIAVILLIYRFSNVRTPENFLEGVSPALYLVIFFAYFSAYYEVNNSLDPAFYSAVSNALKLLSAVLIVTGISYMIYRYTSLSVKQKQAEIQHSLEMNYYEDMMRRNQDIRTFRHDYKNNLLSLNMLIKSQRYDEAEEYIEDLSGGLELTKNPFNSGSYLLDAILADKAAKCREYGIEIVFEGGFPKNEIDNNTICTIFSNAVDNAVRACETLAPCIIKIISDLKPGGVTVKILNPVKEKVIIKNNTIKTTKSDKQNHGIGISNAKKAAQKYDGYVELSCSDTEFEFKAGLIFNRNFKK